MPEKPKSQADPRSSGEPATSDKATDAVGARTRERAEADEATQYRGRSRADMFRQSPYLSAQPERVSATASKQLIEGTLRAILKRNPPTDARTLLQTLEQAFPDRSAGISAVSGASGLGIASPPTAGMSATQASLYLRARAALAECSPRLRALKSQTHLTDPENAEALREIVLTGFTSLVDELGRADGPIVSRVDVFFHVLIGGTSPPAPDSFVARLRDEFGLSAESVVTSEEQENWLNFSVVVDHLVTLHTSWQHWRGSADPLINLDRLLRRMSQLEQAVNQFETALDQVGLSTGERESINITEHITPPRPTDDPELTLEQLLQWTRDFALAEAPTLIRGGGRFGVDVMKMVLKELVPLWKWRKLPDPRMHNDDVELALELVQARLEAAQTLMPKDSAEPQSETA